MKKRILLLALAALLLCSLTACDLFHSHEYALEVVEASCTEGGYTVYTCECGETYTDDEVEAKGHSYEAVVKEATCTEGGYTTYTCHCGDTYVGDAVEAKGHSHEASVTEPTCTEGGYTTYTCACGDTYVGDEVEATGHSHEAVVTEPTCTEGGYTTYTCACGDTYTGDETGALGHSYKGTVVDYTETERGYTLYKCSRCGYSYKDNFTAAGNEVDPSFFDDAVFIGDSVTMALRNYCTKNPNALGRATFLCQGSYSANHAVKNSMKMKYQGKEMTLQDAIAATGKKKVFILLGMNDIALSSNGVNKALENWATMLKNIRAKNPDVQIYIQSGTPIYKGGEKGGLNNDRMDQYNARLKEFAAANGCYYIDIATPMKDSNNGLAAKYCSDKYVHLTQAACVLWISLLKGFVGS